MRKFSVRTFFVLFIAADLVLIFFTLAYVNKKPVESDVPSPIATSAAAAEGLQDPYDFKPSTATVLSAGSGGSLIFAVRGRCDGTVPSATAISGDLADQVKASVTGLLTTLAVKARTTSDYSVVGTTAACDAVQLNSDDAGRTWTPAKSISLWYPDANNVETVRAPGKGASKPGCTVTSLSDLGANDAVVTCSNGEVRSTTNGGDKWGVLGRLDNVRVAHFESATVGYALAKFQGCAGQEFTTIDGAKTWTKGGCITGDPAQAISYGEDTLIAIVGSEFYRSKDKGLTWSQPAAS